MRICLAHGAWSERGRGRKEPILDDALYGAVRVRRHHFEQPADQKAGYEGQVGIHMSHDCPLDALYIICSPRCTFIRRNPAVQTIPPSPPLILNRHTNVCSCDLVRPSCAACESTVQSARYICSICNVYGLARLFLTLSQKSLVLFQFITLVSRTAAAVPETPPPLNMKTPHLQKGVLYYRGCYNL